MGSYDYEQCSDTSALRAREANYKAVRQEDVRLDMLCEEDRPKCRICGGRMDRVLVFTRCPWCGAKKGGAL